MRLDVSLSAIAMGTPRRAMGGVALIGVFLGLLLPTVADARKFYDDDPLLKEPPPMSLEDARFRKLNDYFDLFSNMFGDVGEEQGEEENKTQAGGRQGLIPAGGVNTLGEVLDSAWFTNRIAAHPMSVADVRKGAGEGNGPSMEGPWTIVGAKTQGVTPGFRIRDSRGHNYLLKFDPLKYPEMATGADIIGSHLFHALGYNVPENYLVVFDEDKLVLGDDVKVTDAQGEKRPMSRRDVTAALARVPHREDGRIRGLASLFLPLHVLLLLGRLPRTHAIREQRSEGGNAVRAWQCARRARGVRARWHRRCYRENGPLLPASAAGTS